MLWFSKLGRFFLLRPIDALVSRRLPEGLDNATLIAVDLTDPARCADVFGHMPEVTHVIYAALYEKPGLVQGWFEQDQMQTNLAMLDNVMTPLEPVAKELQHVSLLQGTKAYGVHIAPFPCPRASGGHATRMTDHYAHHALVDQARFSNRRARPDLHHRSG